MNQKGEYQKQYKEIEFIGKGNYGAAVLVQKVDDHDSIFIAKKVMLSSLNKKELDSAFQEVKLLKSLNHPNIVRYIDSFTEESELIIIMEYCEEGDLSFFIKTRAESKELLDERVILNWFLQVCLALDCIHKQKILHRDIKSSNIFLTSNGTVKLGDFGISKVLENTQAKALTSVGTPYYLSPEVCENRPYTYKSDIWALGCVLYETCTLKHAFSADNLLGLVMKIVKDKADPIPSQYSKELQQLVDKLLQKDVKQRYGMSDIFTDKFVKKTMQEFIQNDGSNQDMMKIPIKKTPLHEELISRNKQKQEDKFELDATCISIDASNAEVLVNQLPNPTTLQLLKPYTESKSTVNQNKSPQKATPKARTTTKANQNAKNVVKDKHKFFSPYQQLQKKRVDETKKSQNKLKQPAPNEIFVRGVAKLKKNIQLPGAAAPKANNIRSKVKTTVNTRKRIPMESGQVLKKQPSAVQAPVGLKVQKESAIKEPVHAMMENPANLAVSNMSVFGNVTREMPKDLGATTDTFNLSVTGGFDMATMRLNTEFNENLIQDQAIEEHVVEETNVSADCKEDIARKDTKECLDKCREQPQIQLTKTGLSEQYRDDFEAYNSEDSDHEEFRITLKANDNELLEVINLYKDQLNNNSQHPTFGGLEEIKEKTIESSHETFNRSLAIQNSILSTAESNNTLDHVVLDKKARMEAMREKVKQELGESKYQKIHDYLKDQREKDVRDDEIRNSLTDTYGKEILSQCFFIDQIIFMESF